SPSLTRQMTLSRHGLSAKLERFLSRRAETPYLAFDRDVVVDKYAQLRGYFPDAAIHYSVKANPAPGIVSLLADVGASFNVSSPEELDLCLSFGVMPERISYGSTSGESPRIAYACVRGIRCFAVDSRQVAIGGFARAVRAALADRPELSGHALMLGPGELL